MTVGGFAFALKLIVSFRSIKLSTNFIRGKSDSIGKTKSALSASISIITNLPNDASSVHPDKKTRSTVICTEYTNIQMVRLLPINV